MNLFKDRLFHTLANSYGDLLDLAPRSVPPHVELSGPFDDAKHLSTDMEAIAHDMQRAADRMVGNPYEKATS